MDPELRAGFALAMRALGEPVFLGATAGLRHALEVGEVTAAEVSAFRAALPDGCELHALSPEEEAIYELRATRTLSGEPCGMLSMGGRSMQIGHGEPAAVCSLPFAAFSGRDVLASAESAWPARVEACRLMYEERCRAERQRQGLPLLRGRFLAVTDMHAVADFAGLGPATLSAEKLVPQLRAAVEAAVAELERSGGHCEKPTRIARVIAAEVVLRLLFAPDAEINFPSSLTVSWTVGYFAGGDHGREAPSEPGSGQCCLAPC